MNIERNRFLPKHIGLKWFIAATILTGVGLAWCWPRYGVSTDECIGHGFDAKWVSPPSDEDVINAFKVEYPTIQISDNPMITKELIFEEITKKCPIDFNGLRFIHKVRYRCDVYVGNRGAETPISVLINCDHYHLNGGGYLLMDPGE